MIDYDVYILFSYSSDRREMYYYQELITIRIFDFLIYEMLPIKEPSLNTQSDSISAKLFV